VKTKGCFLAIRVRLDGEGDWTGPTAGERPTNKRIYFYSLTSIILLEWFIYEGFFARFGGVGDMRPEGMRKWEGDTWSL
jgi:hypothetical protein